MRDLDNHRGPGATGATVVIYLWALDVSTGTGSCLRRAQGTYPMGPTVLTTVTVPWT